MARTTMIIADDLIAATGQLDASASLDQLPTTATILEIRIGTETLRVAVPTEQVHGIAATIASDLLACLPVIGGAA